MSLMQFLTVNRTFKGVDDSDSPYRVAEDVYLPKFNTDAATIAAAKPAARATRPAEADLFAGPVPALVEPGPAHKITPSSEPKVTEPAAAPITTAQTQPLAPAGKSGPFSWRSPGKRPRTAVQAELSLDTVKVVRNDLAEADLELVTVGPARSGQLGLAFNGQSAKSATTGRFPWGRFVGRWFMSGRSRP